MHNGGRKGYVGHAYDPQGFFQAQPCPIFMVNEQVHQLQPEMDTVTGVSYPSEMQVHVPTPSTPPGPAEELAKSEGNLEWLEDDINEYYRGPKSSCGKEALRPPKRRGTHRSWSFCSQKLHKEVNLSRARRGLHRHKDLHPAPSSELKDSAPQGLSAPSWKLPLSKVPTPARAA